MMVSGVVMMMIMTMMMSGSNYTKQVFIGVPTY